MDSGQLSELEKFNISWLILDLPSLPILDSVSGNDVVLSLNNSLRFLDSPQVVGRHGITKQTSSGSSIKPLAQAITPQCVIWACADANMNSRHGLEKDSV